MVLSMDRWINKVAVVTGASSGIGAAIAEMLVEEGINVVALARRLDRLEALANKLSTKKGKIYPLQADITKELEVLNAFKYIKDNLGPVHILVNNAGILIPNVTLSDGDLDTWNKTFQVNVLGLCVATREAVKDMKDSNVDGHIIHINSIAGHFVPNFPGLNVYSATKHAVKALAETLRLEFNSQNSKIKITNLSPGPTDTELISGYETFELIAKYMRQNNQILNSEDIADSVKYVLSTPPHVQIQELIIRPIFDAS